MIKSYKIETSTENMAPGDLCKNCNHPRAAHEDAFGKACKCSGASSNCTCLVFI